MKLTDKIKLDVLVITCLTMPKKSIPRIEYLRVQNYRDMRDLELKKITPLTVFLGSNGSGKSTIMVE
ncbi:hypothetical protein ACP6PM_33980 [Dapis sp. BLCC M229]